MARRTRKSGFDDAVEVFSRLPWYVCVGLAVFAYVIGVGAGPSFFAAMKTGGRALGVVIGGLLLGAVATVLAAHALGLEGPILSGIYAGALTNTPALAAASEAWASDLPTVGYSVTYLFGVLGMTVWAVQIEQLADLMKFIEKYGDCVLSVLADGFWKIEIYDDCYE